MTDTQIVEEIVEIINNETGRLDTGNDVAALYDIIDLLRLEGRFD